MVMFSYFDIIFLIETMGKEKGLSAGIAKRRWQLGHWTHTACPSMGMQGKGAGHGQTRLRGGERGRTSDISDRVPQGGEGGVSSGSLPGEGRDTDGDAGAFLETEREGNRDHLGGGKPLSSNMPRMRHASPVAGPQRTPQEHRDVKGWGEKEETTTGRGGGQGQRGDGLRGLRGEFADSTSVQISGEDPDEGGR